jgi:hypothetical protein
MKLYRLSKGCDGEYSCDYYLGLFKTTDAMISFIDAYMRKLFLRYGKEPKDFSVYLNDKQEIDMSGINLNYFDKLFYEIIDTDNLK